MKCFVDLLLIFRHDNQRKCEKQLLLKIVFFSPPLFHFFCCIFARHVQTKCILKTEISPGLHLFSPQWRLKLFARTQGGLPPPTQLTNTGRPGKTVFLQNLHLITEVCVQKISQVQIKVMKIRVS